MNTGKELWVFTFQIEKSRYPGARARFLIHVPNSLSTVSHDSWYKVDD